MKNPGADICIGVLGGGQLGRMLALEARRMGFRVMKWTGGDTSGAAELADAVLPDPFDSPSAMQQFLKSADLATVEFENIPRQLMEEVEKHLPLMPGSQAVAICQHREREKLFLSDHKIPCAAYRVVENASDLIRAHGELSSDCILKTAEFGYDGKGQCPIKAGDSESDLERIWSDFGGARAVLEEKVELAAEISVIVIRSQNGEIVSYDPAENQHRRHILDVSIVPARLPDDQLAEAQKIAVDVAEALDYVGTLGVEFFISTDGRLLVNEMAPRPHNSGHHTLDACACSQFEQQLRAICALPLGSTKLIQPAVMWNLLGDLWIDESTPPDWTPILATPGAALHLYGKSHARPGRKMGHVTFTGATREEAMTRASDCRQAFGVDRIQ